MFDWYHTNASEMTAARKHKDYYTSSMAMYIPRTDGKRNPLQERIFYNVSPDVQEVFQQSTIPHLLCEPCRQIGCG